MSSHLEQAEPAVETTTSSMVILEPHAKNHRRAPSEQIPAKATNGYRDRSMSQPTYYGYHPQENMEPSSPRSSRAASLTSERPSIAASMMSTTLPSRVRPAPAYVAVVAASSTVTDHHAAQLRDEFGLDASPVHDDPALFSEEATALLNSFLDYLLYTVLATARSRNLAEMRPAIQEVLKPRLARDAMASADEELDSLQAGDEDEEGLSAIDENDASNAWNTEAIWKRARLRCMVYSSIGEMEDEDMERYLEEDEIYGYEGASEMGSNLDISANATIYLTSILEHIAGQVLVVAGQAAYTRAAGKSKRKGSTPSLASSDAERVIVQEYDLEKVALNTTLGRLWRTWRRRVRSPLGVSSPSTRSSAFGAGYPPMPSMRRRTSNITEDGNNASATGSRRGSLREVPETEPTETDIAANIPLPMGPRDVDEIEVPGLARDFEEDESGTETPTMRGNQRPTSVLWTSGPLGRLQTSEASNRSRPLSMPPPALAPMWDDSSADEQDYTTPMTSSRRHSVASSKAAAESNDRGIIAGAVAGVTSLAAAAVATIAGSKTAKDEPSDNDESSTPRAAEEAHATTATDHVGDSEGEVLQSKRVSVISQSLAQVSISRNSSNASVSPEHAKVLNAPETPTAKGVDSPGIDPSVAAQAMQGVGSQEDDTVANTGEIGVARTSNVPVSAASAPQYEGGRSYVFDPEVARPAKRSSKRYSASQTAPWAEAGFPERAAEDSAKPRPVSVSRKPAPGEASRPRTGDAASGPAGMVARAVPDRLSSSSAKAADKSKRLSTSSRRDRSSAQRMSSSSAGTSILHSAKDSQSSLGRGRMSEEDRQREFDSLVRRDETVKYTLTPQNMRDSEPIDLPIQRHEEFAAPTTTTKVTVYAPQTNPSVSSPTHSTASRATNFSGVRRPPPQPVYDRKTGMQIREARVATESTRDFADYIRSTGPPRNPDVVPLIAGVRSMTGAQSSPERLAPPRKNSDRSPGSGRNKTLVKGNVPPVPSVNKAHMVPREAADPGSGTGDLIDFIRQGPDGANGHRIPRNVAPWRSTMDSDNFNQLYTDRSIDNTPGTSTNSTKQSLRTSTNSRSGLLPPPPTSQPAYSNMKPSLSTAAENPMPERKRYRVKDPYAIDSDSEDELDEPITALPSKSKAPREESLMDFLNSAPPPPSASEPPVPFSLSEGSQVRYGLKKPSLITGRDHALEMERRKQEKRRADEKAAKKGYRDPFRPSPSVNGGAGSPPRSAGKVPTSPAAILPNISSSSRPPRQKFVPRDLGGVADSKTARVEAYNATCDLADFLRSSGPPEPFNPTPAPAPAPKRKTPFWRTKKTHGDMP